MHLFLPLLASQALRSRASFSLALTCESGWCRGGRVGGWSGRGRCDRGLLRREEIENFLVWAACAKRHLTDGE